VSRFVNKDATQPVDLGPCQCPNKPHERDEALVRSELGYLEILAISAANSAEDVADTFTADASPFDGHPVIVSWNLEDERGPVEVTAIALKRLDPASLGPIVEGVNEAIERSNPDPNGSGAHSANGSRASASPNRQQRRAAARRH
jgi:hypothetical protein